MQELLASAPFRVFRDCTVYMHAVSSMAGGREGCNVVDGGAVVTLAALQGPSPCMHCMPARHSSIFTNQQRRGLFSVRRCGHCIFCCAC